jgi:hypothetical protein
MKNFILSLVVIAAVSAVLQMFLPWWVIALVAFGVGYAIKQNGFSAFGAGFLGIFILWVGYAALLSHANGNLLAHKVAVLLPFKGHVVLLLIATGVVGGLVSGFASLSGRLAANV